LRRYTYVILYILIFIVLLNTSSFITEIVSSQAQEPLYVMFIWHFHQPWYFGENDSYMILPWVRLHSVGNYFKMGYILSKYPDVKAVFTFSGSLITQIVAYLNGSKDLRQILSEKIAEGVKLSDKEIYDIVKIPGGFFDINWGRIVDVVPRYRALRDYTQQILNKYKYLPDEEMIRSVASSYSEQDLIDIAVLFNLFWIDPEVLKDLYPDLYKLRENALKDPNIHFTRDQLREILNVHIDIMKRIFPLYRSLLEKGEIEIIPVPYSHPLSPIITDLGWSEDLYIHINRSIELFKRYFNITPSGVWPAEQAVNDYVVNIFSRYFHWTVSDQMVLNKSGVNAFDPMNLYSLWYINYDDRKIYIYFRDTTLSNLISFEYSRYDPQQATNDLVNRILSIKRAAGPGHIVVIALDGENPWEYYQDFGDLFLNSLYTALTDLQKKGDIKTVTGIEYLRRYAENVREIPLGERSYLDLVNKDISDTPIRYSEDAYTRLPRKIVRAHLGEGSWAGGELNIWIGKRQEDAAWMWLAYAREMILQRTGQRNISYAEKIDICSVEYLLRAEASDWFWWYGGEFGGIFPTNDLYKTYLRKIYECLNISSPGYLLTSFNPDATPIGVLNSEVPKPVEKPPTIDGVLEKDEWRTSLNISIGELFRQAYLSLDSERLYIALIPSDRRLLSECSLEISIYLTTPWKSVSPYHLGYNSFPRYERKDLGIGLFNEIYIKPCENSAEIYTADGRGGWIYMYPLKDIDVKEVIEVSAPWYMLGLRDRDQVFISIAVYKEKRLIETSSRLGLVYQFIVPQMIATGVEKIIMDMSDPVGDDNGPGTYVYPTADVFKPGVFDMTRFRVVERGVKIVFEIYVRDLGGNPWNGPNGFCLQYPQIYIRTTMNLPSRNDTYGLNVDLAENSSWHIAILLAPGWGSDPVPSGERAAIYYYNNTVVVQSDRFNVYADPSRNAIIAEIDRSLLFDVDNISRWVFTVALTSYDGYGPMRVRPVSVETGTWVIGAGIKYAQAIARGVEPRVMDVLAPTKEDQYNMLNSFQIAPEPKRAIIWGVNASVLTQAAQPVRTITIKFLYTTTAYNVSITSVTEILERTRTLITTFLTEITTTPFTGSIMLLITIVIAIILGSLVIKLLVRRRR